MIKLFIKCSLCFSQDLKLINNDLTAQGLIEVLASDDPSVTDGEGCYNLELEVSQQGFIRAPDKKG